MNELCSMLRGLLVSLAATDLHRDCFLEYLLNLYSKTECNMG